MVVSAAEFHVEGDRYYFTWQQDDVGIGLENLKESSDGLHAEISVQGLNASGVKESHIHWGRLNLSSSSSRASLAKVLATRVKGEPIDWLGYLEYACTRTAQHLRTPAPVVNLATIEPQTAELYAVYPLVTLHETNILYGDGGSGKSLLALALGMAVAGDLELPYPIAARKKGPVLYLDYETCQDEQTSRMHSLALGGDLYPLPPIHYRPAYRALADDIQTLRADVQRLGVTFLIVDSMGPACGGEPEKAEVVLAFMNALRSLGSVTRLVISHVAKSDMDKKRARVFGSVYARNLARSCWEVRAAEEGEGDRLTLGLFHEKFNRGKRHKPFGIGLEWQVNKLLLSKENVMENPDLAPSLSIAARIRELLKAGPMSTTDLADDLEVPPNTIRQAVRRTADIIAFGEHYHGGRGKQNQWTLKAHESVT